MSLLALGRRRDEGVPVDPPVEPAPPYPVPSTAPYNVAGYLNTPSPMGAGSAVHPSVWDFGPGEQWHGYRYWMAMTPSDQTNDDYENPCILTSPDGWAWVVPPGLTNPVYPNPPGGTVLGGPFNSDTDLTWDRRTNELVLVYREAMSDGTQQWLYARSPDGVLWPPKAAKFNLPRPGAYGNGQLLSPALVQDANRWLAFTIWRDVTPMQLQTWAAPTLEGQWAKLGNMTGFEDMVAAGQNPWHLDVIHDGSAYRMLLDLGPEYLDKPDGLIAASSLDGLAWTVNTTPVISTGTSAWDSVQLYRSTFAPHENGTHYRVWYSAQGTVGSKWHTGYTELPRSLWPDPPA